MWSKSSLTIPTVAAISICLIGGTVPAVADIIHVPGDFPTIQEAIDAVLDGDEVEVHPGTYNENINFLGKAIRVYGTDGRDVTIIDAQGAGSVVTCESDEGLDTVLEGFTITNGSGVDGGGMRNLSSSPTVTNCTFTGNFASSGGGMYNSTDSSPTVTDCTFSDNSADLGGGMYNLESSPTVTKCTFTGNNVQGPIFTAGGGMYNKNSNPTVTNCTFGKNTASNKFNNAHGGGMHNFQSSPTVSNCTFIDNTATNGGGIFSVGNGCCFSDLTLSGCSFTGNSADRGAGLYNSGFTSVTVANCTFSGNLARFFAGGIYVCCDSDLSVAESVFCENMPDHIAGNWTDDGGNEFCPLCDGDIDGDGNVGVSDLLILLGCFGIPSDDCADPYADINGDGFVNEIDLTYLLVNWGPCP